MGKKRRQHYVWQHYLSAWGSSGHVWCQMGDKRFAANTLGLGQERDFYRLRELSQSDLRFAELLMSPCEPEARALALGWIPLFTHVFAMQRLYRASGVKDEALERELDEAINNLEEDVHARIESTALPLLAALRAGDLALFDDPERYATFAGFIAFQHMRTPGVMKRVLDSSPDKPGDFNIHAAWGLLRTMLATTLGVGLASRREMLCVTLLRANGEEPHDGGRGGAHARSKARLRSRILGVGRERHDGRRRRARRAPEDVHQLALGAAR